jgi:CubicO group peptidase (beta-lactamase class C family)
MHFSGINKGIMGNSIVRLRNSFYILILWIALVPLPAAQGSAAGFQPSRANLETETYPGSSWPTATPEQMGMSTLKLAEAKDYATRDNRGGSGMVIRDGVLVMSWGSLTDRYEMKSSSKSIGVTALGLALLDGKLRLADKAQYIHPQIGALPESNLDTGWLDEISILHLATQTAGFTKSGAYPDLIYQPGREWGYSDGGPNWLAETLTLAYQLDLNTLLFERVFTPLGISESQLVWGPNRYRPDFLGDIRSREFGEMQVSVDAMARLGLLYLRGGRWEGGLQILPESFVRGAGGQVPELIGLPEQDPHLYPNASEHYGLLWWNNADGSMPNVPRDAFWAWGLYESLIVVIPSLDIVATRASWNGWQLVNDENPWTSDYRYLQPFIEPIAQSVVPTAPQQQFRLWTPLVYHGAAR